MGLIAARARRSVSLVCVIFFCAATMRAQTPPAAAAGPEGDVVSVAEAESFAAYLTGVLARPDVDAAFAKVDLDRLLASVDPYVTLTETQRKSARDEAGRLARAALANGPALHVSTDHYADHALVRFLQHDARGAIDFLDLEIGHGADGGVRIVDLSPHRRMSFVSTSVAWRAIAAGAAPTDLLELPAEHVQAFRTAYNALDALRSAPVEKRAAAYAQLDETVPARNVLVQEFLLGASGAAGATFDAALERIAEENFSSSGPALWRFDRAIERRDADTAFAIVRSFGGAHDARVSRAFVALLRGRAWLVAPDLALARESFEFAAQCEPTLDPAWSALVDLALARKDAAAVGELLARWNTHRPRAWADLAREPRLADFARSPEGARCKARIDAGAKAADSAPADADLYTFAFELEAAVRSADLDRLHELVNVRALLETATAGLGTNKQFLRGVRSGAAEQIGQHADLMKAIAAGATFDLLRVRERGGKPTALYRLVFTGGGVEYLEFDIARGEKGNLEAPDWTTFSQGTRVSAFLRETLLPLAADADKGLLSKLVSRESEFVKHFAELTAMVTANQNGEFAKALEIYAKLPEEVQMNRFALRIRYTAAQQIGDTAYEQALADMQKAYGEDPVVDFIALDLYTIRKRYDLVESSLKRLETSLGGDPHCDAVRANNELARERFAEAESAVVRAQRRGLGGIDLSWTLLTCKLRQQRFADALQQMTNMTYEYELAWNDLAQQPEYAGFVASDEYPRWLAFMKARADASAEDAAEAPK